MIAPSKSPFIQDHLSQIVAASQVGRTRPSFLPSSSSNLIGGGISQVAVGRLPMLSTATINTARIAQALEIEREASRKILLARLSSAQVAQPSTWLVKSILADAQISQLQAARRKLALVAGQQQRVSSPSLLSTIPSATAASASSGAVCKSLDESAGSAPKEVVPLQQSLLRGRHVNGSGSSSSSITTLPQGEEAEEEEVRINDVLCGRGGKSNHHPGNKRYRQVVSEMKKSYRTICTKSAKTDLSKAIVDHVIGYGGRFIKLDKSSGKYSVLSLNEARKKTSQALREAKDVKWTT